MGQIPGRYSLKGGKIGAAAVIANGKSLKTRFHYRQSNERTNVMKKRSGRFILATVGELKERYGLTAENRPTIVLDKARVPQALWPLIPYAEFWGVSDDTIREDLWAKASPDDKRQLKAVVRHHDDLLMQWLAGPEAEGPTFSAEYIAFSAMVMISTSFLGPDR